MTVLTIKDETNSGKIINEINIAVSSTDILVRDIIEARVRFEVDRHNEKMSEYFYGFIQPVEAEVALNGYKMKERKKVDFEKQFYIALDAFQKNGYFLLIDNKQAESLDQQVTVTSKTVVSFIKLTPLVGG